MILKFVKKILTLITLIFFTVSCATPTVVNVIGPNDNKLSCEELSAEIAKANQYANEAQKAKKTGEPHNLGAILFFLPGYGMTMKNVEEATRAARERAIHLNKLKEKKQC
tara:strand:+ start:3732 stop:4061 length:330 start_codon:yes stop_codon:yes gene_type:complete